MKRLLVILLLAPLTIIAQVTPAAKGFSIEGKLDGYTDGTQIRLYKNGESVEMASAKLLKGKFAIKGNVAEPVLCFLIIGRRKAD